MDIKENHNHLIMEGLARVEDMAKELNCCLFAVSKTYLTMKEIEHHLPKPLFARIHRSYIINVNFVKVIERSQIKLENGESLIMVTIISSAFST